MTHRDFVEALKKRKGTLAREFSKLMENDPKRDQTMRRIELLNIMLNEFKRPVHQNSMNNLQTWLKNRP